MNKREEIMGRLGKMGGRLFVSATSMRQELEALSVVRLEKLARKLKLVTREEFEAIEVMVKALSRRLEALEGKSTGKKMPSKKEAKSPAKKSRN